MKYLVIGESCVDVFVYGSAVRLAPEAPVPVFNKSTSTTTPGMASNVVRNLRALSVPAQDILLWTNQNFGKIEKIRYVEKKSNHMFLRVDVADTEYGKCDISSIPFDAFDCVIVSDYNKGWLSTEQIRCIGSRSKISILDTKKLLGSWADTMTFIKINETEYERTKDMLTDEIKNRLIVTLGSRGALYQNQIFSCPSVNRVDSCGAGDTFVSAFAICYTAHHDARAAIKAGNNAASIVVQREGVSTV